MNKKTKFNDFQTAVAWIKQGRNGIDPDMQANVERQPISTLSPTQSTNSSESECCLTAKCGLPSAAWHRA